MLTRFQATTYFKGLGSPPRVPASFVLCSLPQTPYADLELKRYESASSCFRLRSIKITVCFNDSSECFNRLLVCCKILLQFAFLSVLVICSPGWFDFLPAILSSGF